ncbi:hypothetical protein [Quatrionicoccus australiensis]|uniref:hypothetical protein n=1 Tax=Quatrionicoccus australiensis TaxID=138118 RepID=UPI001CF80CA7|nr:hypothetical protein [Quatrionicoccus australiensis]UCV13776.1 hypothetical protein KI612_12505 [Quatrionicoccus australiensis]
MSRQDFRVVENHGQIADSIENYYGGNRPPAGHHNARVCPQCDELTWRMTQHCIACGVDLFAIDAEERRERQKWRRLKFVAFFGIIGFAPVSMQSYLPDNIKLPVMVVSVVSMIIAAAIARD